TAKRVARRSPELIDDPLFREFFGLAEMPERTRLETTLGSGVIVDPAGYILTNFHVIGDADAIVVALADGRAAPAQDIGIDPESDLAVLRTDLDNLPVLPLGDAGAVQVGDVVLAIGNPFGVGQTVTQGIVSATGRNRVGINTFENFLQTDAAINPGNSGGALINAAGALIGINTAILAGGGGNQGISFAIPTSMAAALLPELIDAGGVKRGWIGIDGRDVMGDAGGGIRIVAVMRGGPADQAGVLPGDILRGIGDTPVRDSRDAIDAISALAPGSDVTLLVQRGSAAVELRTRVSTRPQLKIPQRG
ncbi:MAG: PDZ domain-containing protein, partial [Gammaproteobacteria bacterium]|nr:PDZ domain-containing protein [Gammaproteobacteria bacterium]